MYDDDHLKNLRRNYLRNSRPKEFRRLTHKGELEEHLEERTDACRTEAKRIEDKGLAFEGQAWQWAIRSVLLEQPWD